jgi:hypothetical protein
MESPDFRVTKSNKFFAKTASDCIFKRDEQITFKRCIHAAPEAI